MSSMYICYDLGYTDHFQTHTHTYELTKVIIAGAVLVLTKKKHENYRIPPEIMIL